jgi:ankyrin repeat protein
MNSSPPPELLTSFVDAALEDRRTAGVLLHDHPELAADFCVALLTGDVSAVEHALAASPAAATAPTGPRAWQPLLYVCFSRYADAASPHAAALARIASLLLARGADPNGFQNDPRWENNPLSCLYAAAGLHNNLPLTRALLDGGAKPDDGESLYHSSEHADLACFRLLLERGASPRHTNALKHLLDREELAGLRLLLAAGADPNEVNPSGETALHWAIWRGRSAAIVEALLAAGASIDARRQDGRTAHALATISGQTETAELLAARGANTELSATDNFLGTVATANPEYLARIIASSPHLTLPDECRHLLPEFASSHRTNAVRGLLTAGVPVDSPGELGGTALHWACWRGYPDVVTLLLEHGASLTVEDTTYHGTPADWFLHGLENAGAQDGDYPQVARLLQAAGAVFPPEKLPTGNAAVDAVLREPGVE